MQLIETLLDDVDRVRRRRDVPICHSRQQIFERVTQVPHDGHARHARATLQRM